MTAQDPLILVIEDEAQVRRFLRASLRSAGRPLRASPRGRRCDEVVHLTPHEYKLFVALAREAGTLLTYRRLLDEVWGRAVHQTHYVRVFMAHLRRKLEADPNQPRWLITESGVGYRMRDE